MRELLTKSQRALFALMRTHRCCRLPLPEIARLLDQSINTVRTGLRVLKNLGWLIVKILGTPWHPSTYECTEEGLKVEANFVSDFVADLKQQTEGSPPVAPKIDTTICAVCAARLRLVPRAAVNGEDVSGREEAQAYKLASAGSVEKFEAIKADVRLRIGRARLNEIAGEPLSEFTVHCISRPLARLPEEWQLKDVLEEIEDKCVKERNRPTARTWGLIVKVAVDEVARFVGRIPSRRPFERAESNSGVDSIAKLQEMGYLKKGAHA